MSSIMCLREHSHESSIVLYRTLFNIGCYFDSCGQDVQRLSVVTSLPHLLKDNRDECLRRVIPKIRVRTFSHS